MKKKQTKIIPLEYEECLVLVEYLELKGYPFAHIHQEMYTTSWKQKMKAKQLGVKAGLPDYIICLPNKLVFLEMKRQKGGVVSQAQHEWLIEFNKYKDVIAIYTKGAGQAIEAIEKLV